MRSRAIFLLVITTACAAAAAHAQSSGVWTPAMALAPESRLWLEGKSNINRFTCRTEGLAQSLRVGQPSEVWEITGLPEPLQRTVLSIPVRSLRCGDPRMDRDLFRAIRGSTHPFLTFRLYTFKALSPTSARAFTVKAVGVLGLAGRENVVMVDTRVERLPDGWLRLRGSKPLRMTDFGIEPPTALLGLVRARDEIVVRFDFVVDPGAVLQTTEATR